MSDLDVPDASWGPPSREVTATMLDDFAAGKIELDELPTFNDWEQGFFKANRVNSGRKVAKVDIEIHHIIPKKISKLLRKKGALPANFNSTPSQVILILKNNIKSFMTERMTAWE